ncbi:hypothetical protein SNOG_06803 [Parastagonospora nodorum SN15]|uniref:Uncharacterized protein n=1 Tax=Phaeosphaeria nodorum (strain SN15 / ATCC MYA-4574 / FGSC 10173) TaxID=321614 RepID=Q0UN61_PHANO|nr:hypothetical protein SNOG_06803 [Parastagonospora nodorum SN15]EAT85454.1 hypothetical protein SNOG_06803 [Parastagonospora nodorum SN15]
MAHARGTEVPSLACVSTVFKLEVCNPKSDHRGVSRKSSTSLSTPKHDQPCTSWTITRSSGPASHGSPSQYTGTYLHSSSVVTAKRQQICPVQHTIQE